MANLLEIIKTAALDAVNNSKPVNVVWGQIINDTPIKIQLEQQLILDEKFVIIPPNFADYEQTILIDDDEKVITVKNALQIADKVILLKLQGGQKYLLLAKMGDEIAATN